MKIAFLILAHRHFGQLAMLVKSLALPNFDIFIHIDKKSLFNDQIFSILVGDHDNVFIVDDRININWGGFSILDVQLKLLNLASGFGNYGYFSFISGQDFPLKNAILINDHFIQNGDKEFLDYFELPSPLNWNYGGMHRFEYMWYIDEQGYDESITLYKKQMLENKTKRIMANNLNPFGGSNWISITIDCAKYILTYIEENPKFLIFFKTVAHPEEIFFQTLIMNSPFRNNVVNDNLRFIDWKCIGPKPKVLSMEDYDRLKMSDKLFARKFDIKAHPKIIEKIQNDLLKG